MSTRSKIVLSGIFVFSIFFLFLVTSAKAEDDVRTTSGSGSVSSPEPTSTPKTGREVGFFNFFRTASPKPERTPEGELREKIKDRLEEGRLRSCQAREDSIKKRTTGLMGLTVRMVGKFDAIVARVKNYYTTKVVPSGKTVANYDELVSDIAAKKTALDTAIAKLPDTTTFDCTEDNPKGLLTDFRVAMQDVKKALKDYRTSIKNLIVAIRSVVGETESESEASPSPVASP